MVGADGAQADVFAARLVKPPGGAARADQRDDRGRIWRPALAGGPEGSLWVAWQHGVDEHFDVLARRRLVERLRARDPRQRRSRERHPAGARDGARRGRVGRLDVVAGRALRGRQLRDLRQAPRSALGSALGSRLPAQRHAARLRAAHGGASRWSGPSRASRRPAVADISAVAYDRWADKSYRVARIEGDQVGAPQEVRLSPDLATGSTASVQAVPLRGPVRRRRLAALRQTAWFRIPSPSTGGGSFGSHATSPVAGERRGRSLRRRLEPGRALRGRVER